MMPLLVRTDELQYLPEGAAILLGYLRQKFIDDNMRNDGVLADAAYHGQEQSQKASIILEDMKKGWFPVSVREVMEDIRMSAPRQSKYLKHLSEVYGIKIGRRGLPAKRWIYLPWNDDNLRKRRRRRKRK